MQHHSDPHKPARLPPADSSEAMAQVQDLHQALRRAMNALMGCLDAEIAQAGRPMTFSGVQCRAARVLLDWNQERLAAAAGVSRSTVHEFEREIRAVPTETIEKLRVALEAAGVRFLQGGVQIPPSSDGSADR